MSVYLKKLLKENGISDRKASGMFGGIHNRTISRYNNGYRPTAAHKKIIEAELKSRGVWDGERSLWSKLTQAEENELKLAAISPRPENPPPVARRVLARWGIGVETLADKAGIDKSVAWRLFRYGPREGKTAEAAKIVEAYLTKYYPVINTQTLWNEEEVTDEMEGKFLFEETIGRFDIKNPDAFMPRPKTEEPYWWPQLRELRESLKRGIKRQDTMAVIGPSGCGKTTLLNSLLTEEFDPRKSPVRIMKPWAIDVEKIEINHVLEVLCREAGTTLPQAGSRETRALRTYRALESLRENDNLKPVLVVEEAHLLTVGVIQTFKRLFEWETQAGQRVLGIVLLAQEEMRLKMGPAVRQFWNRCQTYAFPGLVPNKKQRKLDLRWLEGYMRHRLEMAGVAPEKVFENGAMRVAAERIAQQAADLPLLVNNWLIAALNEAAGISKTPKVDEQLARSTHLGRVA